MGSHTTHPDSRSVRSRRLLVIYNPAAGRSRRRHLATVLIALRSKGVQLRLRKTTRPGDAEFIARTSGPEFDVVIAAGGDGTVNEVINGLLSRDHHALPALGVIPIGTTNVLARDLGIPTRAEALAHLLAYERTHAVHVGQSNGRFFSLMCGVGLDARIVRHTSLHLKRRIGKLAYVWQGLCELVANAPRRYRVVIDGAAVVEACSVIVCKGRFYGGRFKLAPHAQLHKPELHVCLFRHGGAWNTLLYVFGAVTGLIAYVPSYLTLPASRVLVTGHDGDPVQMDGDCHSILPLEVSLCERPLYVVAPYAGATIG